MVAGILGHSPTTIRRYYAKWTPEFQTLQDDLIRKIHSPDLAQTPAFSGLHDQSLTDEFLVVSSTCGRLIWTPFGLQAPSL